MDYITNTAVPVKWDPARYIEFRSGTYDPINAYLLRALKDLPVQGTYTVVDDINRPDMISAAIYRNDTQYWWLLMLYNNITSYAPGTKYLLIPNGTVVKFFSLDDLERLRFSLRAKQLANAS